MQISRHGCSWKSSPQRPSAFRSLAWKQCQVNSTFAPAHHMGAFVQGKRPCFVVQVMNKSFWAKLRALAVLSLGLAGLGAGTIFGSRFTSAYLVQLIFMSAPLFVALLNTVVLKTPLPDKLFPALAATGVGSGEPPWLLCPDLHIRLLQRCSAPSRYWPL